MCIHVKLIVFVIHITCTNLFIQEMMFSWILLTIVSVTLHITMPSNCRNHSYTVILFIWNKLNCCCNVSLIHGNKSDCQCKDTYDMLNTMSQWQSLTMYIIVNFLEMFQLLTTLNKNHYCINVVWSNKLQQKLWTPLFNSIQLQ